MNRVRYKISLTQKFQKQNVISYVTFNIDNKTISEDFTIANHFNSFFTSIAGKLL